MRVCLPPGRSPRRVATACYSLLQPYDRVCMLYDTCATVPTCCARPSLFWFHFTHPLGITPNETEMHIPRKSPRSSRNYIECVCAYRKARKQPQCLSPRTRYVNGICTGLVQCGVVRTAARLPGGLMPSGLPMPAQALLLLPVASRLAAACAQQADECTKPEPRRFGPWLRHDGRPPAERFRRVHSSLCLSRT